MSTQSVATTTSEAPSMDLDDPDTSILSQSTATKKTKKPSKSKKTSRTKKDDSEDIGSPMEVDGTNVQPEPPRPKRAARGRKRSSDVAKGEHEEVDKEGSEQPEPAPKRRATRTRNSTAQRTQEESTLVGEVQADEPVKKEKPKRGRPSKKDIAARSRKASQISTNSETASKSRMPRDSEIDAALEAGLEGKESADEHIIEQLEPRKPSKSTKKASAEPTLDAEEHEPDQEADLPSKKQTNKAAGKRDSTRSKEDDNMGVELHDAPASPPAKPDIHADQEQESNEQDQGATTKGQKKKAETGKGKKSKRATPPDAEPREDVPAQGSVQVPEQPESRHSSKEQEPEANIDTGQHEAKRESDRPSRRRSSMAPPKTTERYSDIPVEKQFTRSFTGSRVSSSSNPEASPSRKSDDMSPLPDKQQSPSPQPSDAENQPPSTQPSTSRSVLSPSKRQLTQTPTGQTPSPNKQDANMGGLKTSHPWIPIDIDSILFAAGSDKENANTNGPLSGAKGDLSTPEKRMTVEQWVYWNAKNGEDRLKRECERLVGQFEREGGRAMRVLEGIECID